MAEPLISEDDAPELDAAFFERATPMRQALSEEQQKQFRKPGRPKAKWTKQLVTLRLDADIVERFRETGAGWQTRMNDALREAVERKPKA